VDLLLECVRGCVPNIFRCILMLTYSYRFLSCDVLTFGTSFKE